MSEDSNKELGKVIRIDEAQVRGHLDELLLGLFDVEHRTTKPRSPRINGLKERMNRTLLDECSRVQGRQTWYLEPHEIQRDLDTFLRYYNLQRSHQGYRLKGKTPAQTLREALGREKLAAIIPEEDTTDAEAAA